MKDFIKCEERKEYRKTANRTLNLYFDGGMSYRGIHNDKLVVSTIDVIYELNDKGILTVDDYLELKHVDDGFDIARDIKADIFKEKYDNLERIANSKLDLSNGVFKKGEHNEYIALSADGDEGRYTIEFHNICDVYNRAFLGENCTYKLYTGIYELIDSWVYVESDKGRGLIRGDKRIYLPFR